MFEEEFSRSFGCYSEIFLQILWWSLIISSRKQSIYVHKSVSNALKVLIREKKCWFFYDALLYPVIIRVNLTFNASYNVTQTENKLRQNKSTRFSFNAPAHTRLYTRIITVQHLPINPFPDAFSLSHPCLHNESVAMVTVA